MSTNNNTLNFSAKQLSALFKEIGIYSPKDEFYQQKVRKHQQVFAYIEQIQSVLNKMSRKRPIVFLDCGCGKSYLSFILYAYCQNVLKREIRIIGVDYNQALTDQCNQSAKELNFTEMKFCCSDLAKFIPQEEIDIVYSLHACNTATDMTIAKGIALNAQYIFSVSCCQHRNRKLISKHPLTKVTRFRPYKERLVDMIGDSMRSLLLEHHGYSVKIFEFIAAEFTPKNIMLRAQRDAVKKDNQQVALDEYHKLVALFHFSPALEEMIIQYKEEMNRG